MYQELANQACTRITRGIVTRHLGERAVTAVLDPYNPTGSTMHVNFTTSKPTRWQTDPRRCHVNWVVCDSDWEAEFCRFVESHAQVRAYVKNHALGLDVPYRYGATARTYLPDFIVLVDDGHGDDDLLHLVVEIKGYRREDAKEKKATHGHLLGARRKPLRRLRPLGLRQNSPTCIRSRKISCVRSGRASEWIDYTYRR